MKKSINTSEENPLQKRQGCLLGAYIQYISPNGGYNDSVSIEIKSLSMVDLSDIDIFPITKIIELILIKCQQMIRYLPLISLH